jgi:hypothetical protein
METLVPHPSTELAVAPLDQRDKLEQLCRDFDTDCVACHEPPFGSYSRCWEYDRSTGFCPFCLPRLA